MLTPNTITIWNASTGQKVSRFTFTETIVAFVFNPFQPENLVRESDKTALTDFRVTFFYFSQYFHPSVSSLSMTSIQAAISLEEERSFTCQWVWKLTLRYQEEGSLHSGCRGSFSPATSSSKSAVDDFLSCDFCQ